MPAKYGDVKVSALTVEVSEILGVEVDISTAGLLREEIREKVVASAIPL